MPTSARPRSRAVTRRNYRALETLAPACNDDLTAMPAMRRDREPRPADDCEARQRLRHAIGRHPPDGRCPPPDGAGASGVRAYLRVWTPIFVSNEGHAAQGMGRVETRMKSANRTSPAGRARPQPDAGTTGFGRRSLFRRGLTVNSPAATYADPKASLRAIDDVRPTPVPHTTPTRQSPVHPRMHQGVLAQDLSDRWRP